MLDMARRYVETVRHLKAEQILYRMRPPPLPRGFRESLEAGAVRGPSMRTDRPQASVVSAAVLDGEFTFWGNVKRLDLTRPWIDAGSGNAWNYPVHYFDGAVGLAAQPDLRRGVMQHVQRWIDVHPRGTRVAWDPYPTALRIVNWAEMVCRLGDASTPAWRQRVLESVLEQAEWLSARLERHLLGTHLLKDLTALLVASTLYDHAAARRWRSVAERLLRRELTAQVHADGSHVEPSPMYHCMAAGDLLDLLNFGAVDGTLRDDVASGALRMVAYARGIETPAGAYPLFGDAWEGGAPTPGRLADYARRLGLGEVAGARGGLQRFADAGMLVWRGGPTYLVADVGGVGADHLPGHGHCDSLSFEWHVNGLPLIVDSGTFTYDPGPLRHACRSTTAHNTLQLDAREQHEVWAAWRVARRSRVRVERDTSDAVEATLEPWHDRRIRVRRSFHFTGARVRIEDFVDGRCSVVSRLHLHPDCRTAIDGGRLRIEHGSARGQVQIEGSNTRVTLLDPSRSESYFAVEPGRGRPNAVVVITSADGPFSAQMQLDPAGEDA